VWSVSAADAPRVAALLRELAERRIDPGRIPAESVAELLAAEGGARGALLGAIAPAGDPALAADGFEVYAIGHEGRRQQIAEIAEPWRRGPDPQGDAATALIVDAGSPATVSISIAADDQLRHRLAVLAERALTPLCASLFLPVPAVVVEGMADAQDGRLEISVDGVTRFAGAMPATWSDWWRVHPCAAPVGRSGACACESGAADAPAQEILACRALEEIVMDDPGLLLSGDAATGLSASADGEGDSWEAKELPIVLRELASRRVPLGPADRLRGALDAAIDFEADGLRASAQADGARLRIVSVVSQASERLIPDNFSPGIHDAIEVRTDAPVRDLRVGVTFRHPFPSDLCFRLTTPNGTTVELPRQDSDSRGRLLVDAAALDHPERLLNQPAAGAWTLQVADEASRDTGTLLGWAMKLTVDQAAAAHPDADVDADSSGSQAAPPESHVRRQVARVQRLARELRPYEVEVQVGERLHDAAGCEGDDTPLRAELDASLRWFVRESGLNPRRAISWKRADELPASGYRIVINGLCRACGELPADRRFRFKDVDDPLGPEHTAVAPWNGGAGAWVAFDEPPSDSGAPDVEAAVYLVDHIGACLSEALAEFVDLSWTQQFLADRSAWLYGVAEPIRDRYGIEVIAGTIEQLVREQVSVRDGRMLEALLDFLANPPATDDLDPAARTDGLDPTPELLATYLWGRLGDAIAFARADEQRPRPLALVALEPASEERLRFALGESRALVAVYGIAELPGLLRGVAAALAPHEPQRPAILTALDLRRHVRRAIAAQFPNVPVLAREQISETCNAEVVGTIALAL
jgi:subtilisin-like proprotein convertase family protein